MKPRETLNVAVAVFGFYSIYKALDSALGAVGACFLPYATPSANYYYPIFAVAQLSLGSVLLRYGPRIVSWVFPPDWPNQPTDPGTTQAEPDK